MQIIRLDKVLYHGAVAESVSADAKLLRVVASLAAAGSDTATVAKAIDLPEAQVAAMIKSKECITLINRIQTAFCPDPAQRVKQMGNLALDTIQSVMLTADKDADKLKAAIDLADRALGKATQVVETRNLNFNVNEVGQLDESIETLQKKIEQTTKMLRMKRVAPQA